MTNHFHAVVKAFVHWFSLVLMCLSLGTLCATLGLALIGYSGLWIGAIVGNVVCLLSWYYFFGEHNG